MWGPRASLSVSPVEPAAGSSLSLSLTLISSTESSPRSGLGDRGPDWGELGSGAVEKARRAAPAGEWCEGRDFFSCFALFALVLYFLGHHLQMNGLPIWRVSPRAGIDCY